jgi:chromosome segregation ATPase
VHALDAKERECAELSAALETGGDRLAAGVRESKIVEMARKNRSLTLAVEKEKAEKARLVTELKAARAGTGRANLFNHAGAPNEDGTPRTESQIEKACREVVAEAAKAAEDASKERAEWKEKAREASARAERDAGRYHTVRAENDRLRAIIKREVGDDKVDFSKLEKSLEAAGGWRGRAREIATLRHKVQRLRDRLELYEDGEQLSVTSTASRFATTGPFGDLPDADLNEGGFEPGSRPGTAATDVSRRTARSFAGASRETAREASARRRQLEEATAALAASEAACEDARAKAKAAGVRKDALERDVRGLREKLDVLKEKSKHDDRLIDALRAENRRARGEAEEALLRETMTSADFRSAGGAGSSRQRGGVAGFQNFAGGSVPVSVYKALERRAEHADAQLRESEQRVLQLRAKIASLENDAAERPKGDGTLRDSSRASIAAAAADLTDDTDLPDVSRQHQDDVAALIEHAEALERETEGLRGRLAVAEKTERALRARLGEAQHETRELKTRLETGAGTGPAAKSAVPAESAGYEGKTNSVDDEDVASLRARLASAEAELERVRRASREQIESMEKEVELYFEMAEEMKRTMRDGGAC